MTSIQPTVGAWRNLNIAVVGGDEREQEICRLAAGTGAAVRAFGFPWPDAGIKLVTFATDAAAALAGAHIALFPIPGIANDGSLFATEKITPRQAMLSVMAPRAHIILGKADSGLLAAANSLAIEIHEYETDHELMLLRAPAIVEAALKVIIENTAITIHGAQICVIGQGNIGSVLTRTLIALGAKLTVAARNPVQRALAYTMGANSVTLDALLPIAHSFDVILATAPAAVVNAEMIDRLALHALIIDLTAPPGSCDLDYARSTGRKAIWARALGRRAPITVGSSQWVGISKIIEAIIARKDR